MGRFKKVIKWIVNIFTYILFAVLILVIYGKATVVFTNNTYPNYFGYTFFEVASGSMEPTLYVSDVILVKITKDNLKENDIIAYNGDNSIITHRIIFMDNDMLTVKGDNNNTIDRPINREQVIGKVVKTYSKLGIWQKVLSEPKIIFAIFITLLLFDFALSYSPNDKKDLTEIVEDNKIDVPKEEDKIESKIDKLMDVTRKIDIEEINSLINEDFKLDKEELETFKEKVNDDNVETPSFTEKEEEFIEYTIRLDLDEIRKKIDSNLK